MGWMVRGSNPGGGEVFGVCPYQLCGPPSLLDTASVLEIKWPGHGIDHLPLSITEVKKRVELYLYSHSGPSWPVLRWTSYVPLPL